MRKVPNYAMDSDRQLNFWGIESLTLKEFLNRLACTADTYKETLAYKGYQLDTTCVDTPSHFCEFYLSQEHQEGSEDVFGFAVLFIKRSGRYDKRSPESIYVANNPDEWINVFRFVADREDYIRTQSNHELND